MLRLLTSLLSIAFVLSACGPQSTNNRNAEQGPTNLVQAEICNQAMQAKFKEQEDAQTAWYKAHTSVVPDPSQRSRLEIGNNGRAVMVVHGFISSPAYVQDIARPLVKQGYTVLSPLLTGFGTDASAANAATAADWRRSIENGMALLKMCYPQVAIVAHSLGGALVTDEIQNRNLGPVSRLVLLAPYFKTYGSWPSIISTLLASRVDVITLDTFRTLTGGADPYEYLPINRPLPGSPEPYLPIPALGRVLELQSGFSYPAAQKVSVPTLVFLSGDDNVVDSNFALQYVTTNFAQPQTRVFEQGSHVNHSMQMRINNPLFDETIARIIDILK